MTKNNTIPYILIGAMFMFVVFGGQFVYRSMQYNLDLVTPNYYNEELKYEAKMDKRSRSSVNDVICETNNETLTINFNNLSVDSGKIKFSRFDKTVADTEITFGKGNKQTLSISRLQKGFWRIEIEYIINGETFIKEQNMNL